MPGEDSQTSQQPQKPAAAPSKAGLQQQVSRDDGTGAAGQAGQEEDAVWRELAEELRQIPQIPEESVQGVEEADISQGLLQRLRQAAGRKEANQAAAEKLKSTECGAGMMADKKGKERQSRPARKQTKTQASGFDPHLMLSRLAQPVTKFTAKVNCVYTTDCLVLSNHACAAASLLSTFGKHWWFGVRKGKCQQTPR